MNNKHAPDVSTLGAFFYPPPPMTFSILITQPGKNIVYKLKVELTQQSHFMQQFKVSGGDRYILMNRYQEHGPHYWAVVEMPEIRNLDNEKLIGVFLIQIQNAIDKYLKGKL